VSGPCNGHRQSAGQQTVYELHIIILLPIS
jgi:hypothetical protein